MANEMLETLKRYLSLASTLVFGPLLSACGVTPVTKFDWLATESAPNSFPMKIISGDFIAPDGSSRYIPNNKEIHHGWGKSISTHVGGPDLKSLPNRMEIKFFSFTEKK